MTRWAVMLVLLAASMVAVSGRPRAQDKDVEKLPDAPAGVWKVFVPFVGEEGGSAKWILELKPQGESYTGSVVAVVPGWSKATIDKITVADGVMRFQLKTAALSLGCELNLPKDGQAKKMRGIATVRKRPTPLELERTTLTSLEPFDLDREAFRKQVAGHEAVQMALKLLGQAEAKKIKPDEVRTWGKKALDSADLYGPGLKRDILLVMAQILADQAGYDAVALDYAERAEKLLGEKEPPVAQKRVLDVLAAALEKSGKEKEAKEVAARLAKLDFQIRPRAFAGRTSKSDRAVVVELFTGAQCPPCVAADLAFDGLLKTYKPSDVILLQYHLHVPGPDPLTSPDSENRQAYYQETVKGTPTTLFNGRPAAGGGGSKDDALEKYEEFMEVLEPMLESAPKAEVKLSATRKGEKISIDAEVDKLEETGDDIRLRLVLVEEEVTYKGSNGLPEHRHVVRTMPGGPDGVPLKEKSLKKSFTVDLDELKKQLKDYLEKANEKRPFPNKERPLELKKLKVVAFVQNDKGGEIFQAAQVAVPEN
ncbi:MAG: DUF1223 domain-containing protein [Gemmataceae bacterium]